MLDLPFRRGFISYMGTCRMIRNLRQGRWIRLVQRATSRILWGGDIKLEERNPGYEEYRGHCMVT